MNTVAIALVVVLVLVIGAVLYAWKRRHAHDLGSAVPGRVWGYPSGRPADSTNVTQQACAAACQADPKCQGYNYLPAGGEPSLCYHVQPGDFTAYPLCISKKAGDTGWWDQSVISSNLMAQKECPSS